MVQFQQLRPLARPAFAGVAVALAFVACGGSGAATLQDPVASPASIDEPARASVVPEDVDVPAAPPVGDTAAILTEAGGVCQAIPVAPAERALGLPITSARLNMDGDDNEYCRVIANDETFLDVLPGVQTTLDDFEDKTEALRVTEPVEGLGESAYRREGTVFSGPGARLAVFTGVRELRVNVYAAADQAVMFSASEQIARAIMEALPS